MEGREYSIVDSATLSNYNDACCTNLQLDWTINFESKQIEGKAIHQVKIIKEGTSTVDFDSDDLIIEKVEVNDEIAIYEVHEVSKVQALGSRVRVFLKDSQLWRIGTVLIIAFTYKTSPSASAIQWLAPELTNGGKYPYLFTQCQAIHARSLLPCQDSPGVKTPYTAKVCSVSVCLYGCLCDCHFVCM